jgi:hypothetical protein
MRRFCLAIAFNIAAQLLVGSTAFGDVDPDCTGDALICARGRADDAVALDALLVGPLGEAGWARSCYAVMYVAGDKGSRDTVVVALQGRKDTQPSTCRSAPRSRSASRGTLVSIAGRVRKTIASAGEVRERLLKNVNTLMVTNGHGDEVKLALP